ncbi:phospholipase D family protein [Sedimentitalea arenosa]|uniref:Phospholipase D n=1 Tax=Sedimentitalea arenosa TaxID=2798803 RepID=A0A8J7JFI0_9RHOB|nr:phospholipase D family protein [Arenibacterium arenosum]MBJ6373424.1 phospholipase D family protein [Arenibacterium arenosum]
MLRVIPSLGLMLVVLAACSSALPEYPRSQSFAPVPPANTRLAADVRGLGNPGDGRSGVNLIANGEYALAARLLLAARADVTLDAQYYLLHDDPTGHIFASSLLNAADRGVRVRLLLDDMDTSGYDAMTAALDSHENIEIRLFNPFRRDQSLFVAGLTDFKRINRRMHNKSLTADNTISIVGGRNIGAEYFLAKEEMNYADLDIMVAGPVVKEVSDNFDDYWNSAFAVPARAVIGEPEQFGLQDARVRLNALVAEAQQTPYAAALRRSAEAHFKRSALKLDWVPAKLYSDPPTKAAGAANGVPILASKLVPYFQNAEESVNVVSAYFVPRRSGVKWLSELEGRGVDVTVTTNSLASNDVAPVYAHYALQRRPLLESGVELHELRPDAHRVHRRGVNWGESRSGLHTKAFTVDNRYLFVGSFNWDPRSVHINTEMGILVDSPLITKRAVDVLDGFLLENTYAVRLEDDRLTWRAQGDDGVTVVYRNEPTGSFWGHIKAGLLAILPIGSQL